MCGIYGELSLADGASPDRATIAAMGQRIVHRGPDDDHLHLTNRAALGLRRLAIIDPAGGRQPLYNEDRSVVAVCNGEIYNFRELRAELTRRGHRFRTGSDAEVIPHLYEEFGQGFVARLEGMFGFALWDERSGLFMLGRDRLGIKPVYYARVDGRLAFASEVKALLARPDLTADLDPEALEQFLALGYVPNPYTLFRGVRMLPPGCILTSQAGRLSEDRYWALDTSDKAQRSESAWIEALRAGLDDSIRAQMVSDVPIAAFLSGGIDSSTIVAYMSRHSTEPVKTYAIGYQGSSGAELYNELDYARLVAEAYGTDHHEIVVQPDVIGLLPRLVWHMDAPISDSALITSNLVSEFAAREVKVILSGVGGDELFGGYDRYLLAHYVGLVRRLPGWVRNGILAPAANALPVDRHSRMLNAFRYLRSVLLLANQERGERYHALMEVFSRDQRAALLRQGASGVPDALAALLARTGRLDELDGYFMADIGTQMTDDLLLLTDKMSMAHSLECRVPLLDECLVTLAATMPADLRVRGSQTRYLIRKALRGVVPDQVLDRKKRGFGAPVGAWLKAELGALTGHLLAPAVVEARGLFRPAAVTSLVEAHRGNRADHTDHLFALITLEIWQRLFIDGRSVDDVAGELAAMVAAR
jgi:asparagine synthase (glutamine-hydrolysing)